MSLSPDELLRRIEAQEHLETRGRLKIFLGYASRVGKSERMLDEGRRRKERGQDVFIPPPDAPLDLDMILKRAPQVCIIDHLAQQNPRWQDIEKLRARGINVIGALNLHHIAEQQDAVERITGHRATASVPEAFVKSADELVVVDVPGTPSPQMNELRELTLLLAAEVVEEQLQRYMNAHGILQSWGTQERILVCITPRSSAKAMLESGARATERFHGHLLAVYVTQEDLPREEEEILAANLDQARKAGAEVHTLEGADPIAAILQFAREQRVTQIFIGHTQQKSWKFWTHTPVARLIKAAEGMDVRLFPRAQSAA